MLVRQAKIAREGAYGWTRQVLARYRGDQFHLGGNTHYVRPRFLRLTLTEM